MGNLSNEVDTGICEKYTKIQEDVNCCVLSWFHVFKGRVDMENIYALAKSQFKSFIYYYHRVDNGHVRNVFTKQ